MAWHLPKSRVPYVSTLALTIAAGACGGPPKNQDQSGVTNSSGKSTLANPQQTDPTAGQAVTAKGDTLKQPDSTMGKRR